MFVLSRVRVPQLAGPDALLRFEGRKVRQSAVPGLQPSMHAAGQGGDTVADGIIDGRVRPGLRRALTYLGSVRICSRPGPVNAGVIGGEAAGIEDAAREGEHDDEGPDACTDPLPMGHQGSAYHDTDDT